MSDEPIELNREEAMQMAIMALMMANEIGDEDIPDMIRCGCQKCLCMAALYTLVRDQLQPFLTHGGSGLVN